MYGAGLGCEAAQTSIWGVLKEKWRAEGPPLLNLPMISFRKKETDAVPVWNQSQAFHLPSFTMIVHKDYCARIVFGKTLGASFRARMTYLQAHGDPEKCQDFRPCFRGAAILAVYARAGQQLTTADQVYGRQPSKTDGKRRYHVVTMRAWGILAFYNLECSVYLFDGTVLEQLLGSLLHFLRHLTFYYSGLLSCKAHTDLFRTNVAILGLFWVKI